MSYTDVPGRQRYRLAAGTRIEWQSTHLGVHARGCDANIHTDRHSTGSPSVPQMPHSVCHRFWPMKSPVR